jgi:hypothetical protein
VSAFSAAFRQAIIEQELGRFEKEPTVRGLGRSLALYCRVNAIYRECGVNSPILMATYQEFEALWTRQLKTIGCEGETEARQRMTQIWRDVPYQALKTFLSAF